MATTSNYLASDPPFVGGGFPQIHIYLSIILRPGGGGLLLYLFNQPLPSSKVHLSWMVLVLHQDEQSAICEFHEDQQMQLQINSAFKLPNSYFCFVSFRKSPCAL